MKKNVFAIDGLCASGKGTISKQIANYFKIPYLNTGALYRAIGYHLYKQNFTNFQDINSMLKIVSKIDFSDLENPEFFTEDGGKRASNVSKIPEIRKFLFNMQVDFANQTGGAVLDGRDIGTVICPDAQYKFFIVASAEERANRRYKQCQEKGIDMSLEEIKENIQKRDYNDINRPVAPLIKAVDAIEIDTTNMNKQETFEHILSFVK